MRPSLIAAALLAAVGCSTSRVTAPSQERPGEDDRATALAEEQRLAARCSAANQRCLRSRDRVPPSCSCDTRAGGER